MTCWWWFPPLRILGRVEIDALYREHVRTLGRRLEAQLEAAAEAHHPFDGVLLHAGGSRTYFADDQHIAFRATPHFRRWTPIAGPDHWLCLRPGQPPRAIRVTRRDFWEEPPGNVPHALGDAFCEVFDVTEAADPETGLREWGDVSGFAYIGPDADEAARLGIDGSAVQPASLLAPLDWDRAHKTPFEVHCLRRAAANAAPGHAAARAAALAGRSERAIHAAYLEASGQLDGETPYPNIIAWNEHAAVLHYGSKTPDPPAQPRSFLIDAGASADGYASDITRTYAFDAAAREFVAALDAMDRLQRELVERVAPGTAYLEVHTHAIHGVARILNELGVFRVTSDDALARGVVHPFMPHGVGHHLGIQVHDVGGTQISPQGGFAPPPHDYPTLRTTRVLAEGHVVTVEPGLYFIPLLLDPYRAAAHPDHECFDWDLVDHLLPCGGIRVEDDILVTESGREDLTRGLVPGHLE